MTAYRRNGGTVTRAHLRAHSGGRAMGAGRRIKTPGVPSGTTTYSAEPLGAGGWVTGLAISPDGLTRLGRTDTLGAWRWDSGADKWMSATTATSMPSSTPAVGSRRMFPYNALDSGQGVQGFAVANDIAYMAYLDAIFTSTNKGVTWQLSLTGGPKTSANTSGVKRWTSHMAVDPNNSAVCIYGTLNAGLWYTLDSGATWTQVPSGTLAFGPDGAATPGNATFGIPAVMIDSAGAWYASPFGLGLYKSTDHGSTWTKISSDSQIACIVDIEQGPNGDIMVAGWLSSASRVDGTARVYRYRSGTWAQMVMPGTARNWNTIAYDPRVPGRVLVQASDGGYERLTLDYGTTWSSPGQTFAAAAGDIPWLEVSNGGTGQTNFFVTTGGLQFDPLVTNRIWMSQGIGVWYADLPTDPTAVIPWHAQSRGIEQLVVNDVTAPPGGRAIVTCWDRPIFVAGETTGGGTYPYQYHPDNGTLSSGWHADYSADDPTWLAASVWDRSGFAAAHPGYSTDGGLTWTTFATIPTNSGAFFAGSVHVGAPGHIIWVSAGGKGAAYTTDSGTTWTTVAISGVATSNLNTQVYFYYRRPIASEKTAGSANTFYAFVNGSGVYKSTDTGATWTQQCNSTPFSGDWSQMVYLKSVPNNPGHLFIVQGWQGAGGGTETKTLPFKRSVDGGVTWTNVPSITSVRGFDFGAPGPGYTYPAIYAVGWVGGVKGVYRSTDGALTWTLLTTQPNDTVDFIRNVAASKDTFGTHWIATAGSGLIRGQLA